LLQAIDRALANHRQILSRKGAMDGIRSRIATLTPRERQVFELVVRGKTNKQVGNALGATERTIKAHRHRVMEKMEVQSLAELVALAERTGVLSVAGNERNPG
jgi:FixJ family two-component response regulator